jgi:4-diphosphocytidyl-2-C-methyl-D-erythritol kinase
MNAPFGTYTFRAPAKLNLALSVGPPEPPKGYHPIASLFVAIDLCDEIEISRQHPGTPSTYAIEWAEDAPRPSPIDWPIEKDLGVRAHRLLESHLARELPIRMRVRKRVPVGAGLGGGSSDAGAVLVGLNQCFNLDLDLAALRSLSTALGSDIAFFLDWPELTPALVTGFGERIMPTSIVLKDTSAVLILPPFGCPTGPVYQAFDAQSGARLDEARVRAIAEHAERTSTITAGSLFNDLAAPACAVQPELGVIIRALSEALGPGRPVHVTGSGSTLFVLSEAAEAPDVVATILRTRPDLVCRVCAIA